MPETEVRPVRAVAAEPQIFPESPRVIYAQNPLAQVICQVQFPPILRIETEVPASFQDRIRHHYPLFRETKPSTAIELPPGVPPEFEKAVDAALSEGRGRLAYEFRSDDRAWTVGLTRDSMGVSTSRYERWEVFKEHVAYALSALMDSYSPSFFTRVGLRYQNAISRSTLGLSDTPWLHLLEPHIAGELSCSTVAPLIKSTIRYFVIEFPDQDGQVRMHHGLAQSRSGETVYVIDSDFFLARRIEVIDATRVLDHFNRQSGRLFRWCITDRLHGAMGPRPI